MKLRRFADLRIRYKLLISYSAVFFLSITLGSVVIYSNVRRHIESSIESELKNTTATILNMARASAATAIKNHLRAVAEKNFEIVEYLYKQYQSGVLDEFEAKDQARAVLLSQTIGKTGYIYILSSDGIILIHPREALHGADLSEYDFIQDQRARKAGYLEYYWKNPGEAQARPKALYMKYFAPWDWIISVSSYRNEFYELVQVDDFRESILSLQFGKTGYSYVLDSRGNLILHPKLEGHNYYDAQDAQGRYFIREICRRKSGKITYSWKNPDEADTREKLVIFNYIPEYDWIVASSSYLEEFYAPLHTIRNIIFFTVLVSLTLVIPLSMQIGASITNPLRDLMNSFRLGADGDISVRMRRRSRDEIGRLASYFNGFMERLEAYQSNLEGEIKERKQAEEALRESELQYRLIAQNVTDMIWVLDIDTYRFTYYSPSVQRIRGFAPEEALNITLEQSLTPESWNQAHKVLDKSIAAVRREGVATAEPRTMILEMTCKDGGTIWTEVTTSFIWDESGQAVNILGVSRDITKRQRTEQEMVRMRYYLKNIVDSMPSVLVGVDAEQRVTQWNREAEKMTGVPQEQALGADLESMLPQLDRQVEIVRRALQDNTAQVAEKVRLSVEDEMRYFDIMVYPLVVPGVEGAVVRLDDVTDRVRMEDMMIQTEKMMSIGGLAAGMAHEINNPVGGMIQSVQNIMRRLSVDLPDNQSAAADCGTGLEAVNAYLEQREILRFLNGIRESGIRTSEVITNMLNFSRNSDSRKMPVDMAELLDKTIELAAHDYDLKKKYDFRRIAIVRDFSADLPEVPCVATQIEQVLLNLLRNAAQAMAQAPGPQPPRIILKLRVDAGFLNIGVTDTGPGIAEKARHQVFEPFYTTKDVGVGTGLGLSVAYFIVVNNHKGIMSVESRAGQGATFLIRLPLSA